ncbi:MAG TPA: DinB family protein [Alphaproteobacteria bacterium]|nr:DinB family protein [Alphaproteobacteria bacterium]
MEAAYFHNLARYNAWANRRLYAACAQLPDVEYHKPRLAFFGSIHGTLNHLIVGDRIWLGRITGEDSGLKALDQILYDDLVSLRKAREAEDARLITIVDGYDDAALDRLLAYHTTRGEPQKTRLAWILAHLFNHQTHHRAQVHDMLSQTLVPPPPLDLILYLRETAAA